MKLANAAAAPALDPSVREPLTHFFAAVLAQARLDAMLVGGAQLDRRKADVLTDPNNRRQIPRSGDVVSDDAEMEFGSFFIRFNRVANCGNGCPRRRAASCRLQKSTPTYFGHSFFSLDF